jgi:diguanylate cyclase (GGDEF)-like protein
MILEAANRIKDAFVSVEGQYFRIGGDEFVVILTGDRVQERCTDGTQRFEELVYQFNLQSNREFHLSIAQGCSIYDSDVPEKKIFEVYQEADARMYQNKKKMKQSQKRGNLYETEKLSHAAASLR